MDKQDWTEKIKMLEDFFKGLELPKTIQLSESENIIFPKLFVASHLCLIRANNGNKTFIPYAIRLNRLKEFLTKNNQTNVKKENRTQKRK